MRECSGADERSSFGGAVMDVLKVGQQKMSNVEALVTNGSSKAWPVRRVTSHGLESVFTDMC